MEHKEVHAGPTRRKTTCSSCRRRKSKCDSREPQCSTCIAHNSPCRYDKPASLIYVRSLEAKIELLLREKETAESSNFVAAKPPDHVQSHSDTSNINNTHDNTEAPDQWVSEISVDSNGLVCYYNLTSAIHEAPSDDPRSNTICASSPETICITSEAGTQQMDQIKRSLVSNAAARRRFETIAVENMAVVQNEVSREMATEFLKLH